jgi:hypothetical protein
MGKRDGKLHEINLGKFAQNLCTGWADILLHIWMDDWRFMIPEHEIIKKINHLKKTA